MQIMAVAACLVGAFAWFMWLLTRGDKSSIYWAQEVQNIAVRRSEMIARNTIGSMPRSVMQLFPVIFLMCAMIVPAAAQQRQWTPDDLDFRSPFGDIPTGTANRSQRDFHIFFDNLSAQERLKFVLRIAPSCRSGRSVDRH